MGLLPCRGHQPLQSGEAGADNTLPAELITGELEERDMGRLISYAQVSTADQDLQLQIEALQHGGCRNEADGGRYGLKTPACGWRP